MPEPFRMAAPAGAAPLRPVRLAASVDGRELTTFVCDGLIAAMRLVAAMIRSNPSRTSSAFCTPRITPPMSVLCRISGEAIFMTTGYPISSAMATASSGEVASLDLGMRMPHASRMSRASASPMVVRPSSRTLAKKHGAAIAVDDAHSIGVLGPTGAGTAEHHGLTDEVEVQRVVAHGDVAHPGEFHERSDVEVVGEALRFHESLPAAGRAADKVSIARGLAVEGFGERLAQHGHLVNAKIGVVHNALPVLAAVGVERDYGGILGRADRLVLMMLAPLVLWGMLFFWNTSVLFTLPYVDLALTIMDDALAAVSG